MIKTSAAIPRTFHIGVGSTNPVKVAAANEAFLEVLRHHSPENPPSLTVTGYEVESGVSVQPVSDEETRRGAQTRARSVLDAHPELDAAVGLEGGVMSDEHNQLWTTVWICVLSREEDGTLREGLAAGGRIRVPSRIAEGIRQGGEMGPVMDAMLSRTNMKHAEGLFGVVTQNVVPRQREYQEITVMATALWWTGETELG